jgi:hypothetical protein
MNDEQDIIDLKSISRRELVRKGAKVAYVVPAVLAAIKATERPAFAQFSCAPNEIFVPTDGGGDPTCEICPPGEAPAPDGLCAPAMPPDAM